MSRSTTRSSHVTLCLHSYYSADSSHPTCLGISGFHENSTGTPRELHEKVASKMRARFWNLTTHFCHLKENRGKLALINRLWKSKKGERLRISANSFTKIDQHDDPARCGGPNEKIRPAPGTNQIAGFVEFRPLTS